MVLRFAMAIALGIAAAASSQGALAEGQVEIGRFQVVLVNDKAGNSAVLIDTVTGRSWILSGKGDRRWADLNFGGIENGHLYLTPPGCTYSNPTCYFPLPENKKTSNAGQ